VDFSVGHAEGRRDSVDEYEAVLASLGFLSRIRKACSRCSSPFVPLWLRKLRNRLWPCIQNAGIGTGKFGAVVGDGGGYMVSDRVTA